MINITKSYLSGSEKELLTIELPSNVFSEDRVSPWTKWGGVLTWRLQKVLSNIGVNPWVDVVEFMQYELGIENHLFCVEEIRPCGDRIEFDVVCFDE